MNALGAGISLSSSGSKLEQRAETELRDVARQFETLFVKTLLKGARAAPMGDDGLGEHGDFVRDQYDATMAKQLGSGGGLGLADMLVRQLSGSERPLRPASGLQRSDVHGTTRPAGLEKASRTDSSGFSKPADFVRAVRPHAQRAAAELGVSERIVLAQAALESDWGRRMPLDHQGESSHNLFGIKASRGWDGEVARAQTTEFREGQERTERAGFRKYPDFAASFDDYVGFLRSNPRYEAALNHQGNDEAFLNGLKSAGYATDPDYVNKIKRVANSPLLADVFAAYETTAGAAR